MRALPGVDLRIAGSGAFEADLRAKARALDNVHFEGRLDSVQLGRLFRGARAVVVPSLVCETFGYVVLEAFAEATPVIVRDLGALPELVAESGGGLVFDSQEGLVEAIGRLANDPRLAATLGANGYRARRDVWSEAHHLERYFDLIDQARRSRRVRFDRAHTLERGLQSPDRAGRELASGVASALRVPLPKPKPRTPGADATGLARNTVGERGCVSAPNLELHTYPIPARSASE
jgi:hypothetical protein